MCKDDCFSSCSALISGGCGCGGGTRIVILKNGTELQYSNTTVEEGGLRLRRPCSRAINTSFCCQQRQGHHHQRVTALLQLRGQMPGR